MSVHVTSQLWRRLPYEGAELLVMMALGDYASEEGHAFPSYKALAAKARCSVKTVQRVVARAERDGYLVVDRGSGKRNFTVYDIQLDALPEAFSWMTKEDKMSAFPKPETGHLRPVDRTSTTSRPDIDGIAYKEEPSVEPSIEQSRESPSQLPAEDPNDPPKPADPKRTAVRRVFEHYIAKTGRLPAMYLLTPLREKKGMARLTDCLKITGGDLEAATELMVLAVDRLCESDWHMGRNPRTEGKKYNSWEDQLFGSAERLDKWLQD